MKDLRPFRVWILIQALLLATVLAATSNFIIVEDCVKEKNEMACFASSKCFSDSDKFLQYTDDGRMTDNCDAVLKIRAYSNKHWLVVMESFNKRITSISVKDDNGPFLSCTMGKATHKNGNKKLINTQGALLKCEFFVEDTAEIYPDASKDLALFMNTDIGPSTGTGLVFTENIKVTCDPRKITLSESDVTKGDYTFFPVDAKERKVTCKEGSLEYAIGQSGFVKAAIECGPDGNYHVDGNAIQGDFQARCTIIACDRCDYPLPGVSAPRTLTSVAAHAVDGTPCKILKCDKGQLKSGGMQGSATCKYQKTQGRHMWQMDADNQSPIIAIDTTTKVECVPPFPCTAKVVEDMCNTAPDGSRCTAMADKVSCPNDNDNIQINDKTGNVKCETSTGKWLSDGAELPADAKLSCLAATTPVPAAREDSASEGNIGLTIGSAFAGVFAFVAAGLFAYYFLVVRKRTAAAAAQPPDAVKVAAPAAAAGAPEAPSSPAAQPPNAPGAGGEPKSLESKSNTSKKGNEAKVEPKEDKPMTNEEIREKAEKMIKEAQQLKDMADGVPEKPGPPPTTLQSIDDATHGGTVMMRDGDKLVPVDMARTTAGPAAPAAKAAPKK